jgi:hypothetical protein
MTVNRATNLRRDKDELSIEKLLSEKKRVYRLYYAARSK